MIDEATVERWMREANPIRSLDDVDADEFARFVATAHTRRAAIMQAPTQHPTPTTTVTPPPQRRRKAWAFATSFFVLILLVVGVAAWLLPNDEAPVTDEPATPTTETNPEVATTAADEPEVAPPADPEAPVVTDGWREVATRAEQPWVEDIHQIEPLPGGGYVAVGRLEDLSFVMWSPNGVDWFDGDPQRLLESVEDSFGGRSLAAVGSQIVVLHDTSPHEIALSIGDPRTGTWERVPLDATGVEGHLFWVTLAANDEEVLVAALARASDSQKGVSTQVMVWLVDTARGTSTRNPVPIAAMLPARDVMTPLVEWVDQRWIMIALEDAERPERGADVRIREPDQRNTLWTSPDGRAWSQVVMAEGMDGVTSLVAGPSGVAAATCGLVSRAFEPPDDGFWYSSDGLDWSLVPQPEDGLHGNPVIASWGSRGFVIAIGVEFGTGVHLIAADGSGMELMPSPFDGARVAAASGDTLIASPWIDGGLWLYQEPTSE